MSDETDHLSEWMKLQEEANKQIAETLLRIDARLMDLHDRLCLLEREHCLPVQFRTRLLK